MITSNVELSLPTDEELERLADYLSGSMTTADAEAFDRQLETDAEFFYRMAPMLDVWYSKEPLPAAKTTPTGVTLRLHVPATVIRYGRFAAAAAAIFSAALYNPVATTVLERVAFGPAPAPVTTVHHPRQPRNSLPAPTAVRVATHTKAPSTSARAPEVIVAELPTFVMPVDSAVAIGSLPPARAIGISAEAEFEVHGQQVVVWERPIAGPNHDFSFGGVARAVGDKVSGLLGWIRHPRTHKPTPH